jgi:hypothetical protein
VVSGFLLGLFFRLKMEVICYSDTLVDFQRTACHYILEDRILHNDRCENLKSSIMLFELIKKFSFKFPLYANVFGFVTESEGVGVLCFIICESFLRACLTSDTTERVSMEFYTRDLR